MNAVAHLGVLVMCWLGTSQVMAASPVDVVPVDLNALIRDAANNQYVPQIKSFKAIMMDVGLQDPLLKGNVMMHEALLRVGVAHEYVNYEGDHVNKIPERFEKNVLPWFAGKLAH